MNEEETLEWLEKGVDIPENLSRFKFNGNIIVQKSINDLKKILPMKSALKINKAIAKASDMDLLGFSTEWTRVLKEEELQSIDGFFTGEMNSEDTDESVLSIFGDKFSDNLKDIKEELVEKEWPQKVQQKHNLNDDELIIYASFITAVAKSSFYYKIFKPFISRVPADFFKCKDYIIKLLSVLRKLPKLEEGTYKVKVRHNINNLKVGDTFVFPSFAFAEKSDDDYIDSDNDIDTDSDSDTDSDNDEEDGNNEKSKEHDIILRIRGRVSKGYKMNLGDIDDDDEDNEDDDDDDDDFIAIFEPGVHFKVTKIKKEWRSYAVYGEFVDKGKPILEDILNGVQQKCSAMDKEETSDGPKYAERFPASLSEILEIGNNYKVLTLEEAVKKANFDDTEKIISVANVKMEKEELKRISKDFDLTEEDIKAIFIYTFEKGGSRGNSPYNVVNRALSKRSDIKKLLQIREYIFYLLMALRKLPRFKKNKAVLYRGVNIPKFVAKSIYREGRTLTWTSFSSTSTDEKKAYEFAGDNGVIFEIHGKFRGYSIGTFSNYSEEEEIVLEPDTKFTVMLVCPDEKKPEVTRIVLDVKETEPTLESELGIFESYCEGLEEREYETEYDATEKNLSHKIGGLNSFEPMQEDTPMPMRGGLNSMNHEQEKHKNSRSLQNRGKTFMASERELSMKKGSSHFQGRPDLNMTNDKQKVYANKRPVPMKSGIFKPMGFASSQESNDHNSIKSKLEHVIVPNPTPTKRLPLPFKRGPNAVNPDKNNVSTRGILPQERSETNTVNHKQKNCQLPLRGGALPVNSKQGTTPIKCTPPQRKSETSTNFKQENCQFPVRGSVSPPPPRGGASPTNHQPFPTKSGILPTNHPPQMRGAPPPVNCKRGRPVSMIGIPPQGKSETNMTNLNQENRQLPVRGSISPPPRGGTPPPTNHQPSTRGGMSPLPQRGEAPPVNLKQENNKLPVRGGMSPPSQRGGAPPTSHPPQMRGAPLPVNCKRGRPVSMIGIPPQGKSEANMANFNQENNKLPVRGGTSPPRGGASPPTNHQPSMRGGMPLFPMRGRGVPPPMPQNE